MVGNGWTAVMSIAFLPLYIHFMGIESYGLVGFYVVMQSLLSRLDMGVTAVVSRELARLSAKDNTREEKRHLVRTLEVICWLIAISIIILVSKIAPWLSSHWLDINNLSVETVGYAIEMMGGVIALRLLYGFYSSALLGLQHQVLLNIARILIETFIGLGTVLVLWKISPTVDVFFIWHVLANGLGVLILALLVWRCLPGKKMPKFSPKLFMNVWRFAAGMTGISLLGAFLVQIDKFVLSKMVPLEIFGYYVLASSVAMSAMYLLGSPIYVANYPRFTQYVENNNKLMLSETYHKSCQFMTVIVVPAALIISFFSKPILEIWTQDIVLASYSAPILSVLVLAAAVNSLRLLPYTLQLANGWTMLSFYMNLSVAIFISFGFVVVVPQHGALGGAMVWLLANIIYIIFYIFLMHRKLLIGELFRWLTIDLAKPGGPAFLVVLFFWLLMPSDFNNIGKTAWIFLAGIISVSVAVFSAPTIRREIVVMSHCFLQRNS